MADNQKIETMLVYVDSSPDDAIGENILKLPFLRAIREAFPSARLAWIPGYGPSHFEGCLAPLVHGMIDEVITDLYIDNKPAELLRNWRPLGNRRFDLVFDTQRNVVRTLVLRRIKHGVFISGCWRYVFSDRKPSRKDRRPTLLTDKLLEAVEAATGNAVRPPHIWPLSEPWREAARTLLPGGQTYVGFAPGAGTRESGKCWPIQNYIALAREQKERDRIPVFFIGPNEAEWMAEIQQQLPTALFPEWETSSTPNDMAGPPLAMALAGRLKAAVANCSGIGHILAAGGAPLVSLFGPTRPSKFAAYTPDLTVLRGQAFDSGGAIDAIPLAAVREALERALSLQLDGGVRAKKSAASR